MEHQMKLITSLCLLVISSGVNIGSCYGSTFHVGGKDGWVVDPRESYNHWAERNRFQVNDSIVFKYKKGTDSVLLVDEEAYHKCNKTNPEKILSDDKPVFKFKRSGPFFFISGHDNKCENGEKLIIGVMGVTHHNIPVVNTTIAPPTAALGAPDVAPSATLQTTSGTDTLAPAPGPGISGVVMSTGPVGLISGLFSLCLILFW